jgi:hypothetical protein
VNSKSASIWALVKGVVVDCVRDGKKLDFCYDLQRGHVTLGQNGLGHAMSVQVGRLVIAQVISFKVSLSL